MTRTQNARTRKPRQKNQEQYWDLSKQPLQVLTFLLPLILAYELALSLLLTSHDSVRTVLAHSYLLAFFDAFNIAPEAGLHLGGVAIAIVLIVWHLLNHDPWQVELPVVGLMAIESLALTFPLIILGQLLPGSLASASAQAGGLESLDVWSKMAISVGAGLYEELIFRMLLIALIHTVLVDLGKMPHRRGAAIAVIISAVAFALYHPVPGGSSIFNMKMMFYLLAGIFFGSIFVMRGFGIVVGAHALYDIAVSLFFQPEAP